MSKFTLCSIDPANKNANVTLSNSNLTATTSNNNSNGARGLTSHTGGKWYFEVVLDVYYDNHPLFGVANASWTSGWSVGDSNSWGYYVTGLKIHNSSSNSYGTSNTTAGNVYGVAVDLDNGEIYIARNGTWIGDPIARTNPMFTGLPTNAAVYPAFAVRGNGSTNATLTARFGVDGAFSYPMPAGYTEWDGSTVHETLTLTDAPSGVVYGVSMSDTLTITDSEGTASFTLPTLADTLVPSETLTSFYAAVLTDTLALVDALSGKTAQVGTLADTLVPIEVLSAGLIAQLTDTLVPTEVLSGNLSVSGTLQDALVWAEALSGVAQGFGTLADILVFHDELLDDISQTQKIFVVNAETGAISEYVLPVAVESVASWKGTVYWAGTSGLYAMDSAVDLGTTAISWELRTGFTRLSNVITRLIDAIMRGRSGTPVGLIAVSAESGDKVENLYSQTTPVFEAHGARKIKPGKGIASSHWQIGLYGTGPAEIDELEISFANLSRRI